MKNLELVLLQDVAKLGKKGDIVRVKPGYARNFLMPMQFAKPATKENIRMMEVEKKRFVQKQAEKKVEIQKLAEELELVACAIESKANEEGNLFGSVTYAIIAEGFRKMGFEVNAEDIELEDPNAYPIKALGIFPIQIRLHAEVTAKSKVWVVNEAGTQ